MARSAALVAALGLVAAACSGTGGATTTSPTVDDDTPFELVVSPIEYFPIMPGQRWVVLVSADGGESPVGVTATISGAGTIEPGRLDVAPGKVGEFTVVAASEAMETSLTLDLVAERGVVEETRRLVVEVVDWSDDIGPLAADLRDRFVAHLEVERPELGITADTVWAPTITKPQILVVMHYLFYSDDWEMGIMWHVTLPENAWSRMYLRPRDQLRPTIGLEIPSYLDPDSLPVPWPPPDEVDR